MAQRRRVAVVTGSRAEYGLLRSPMRHIAAHPKLTLQVIATGMHLLRDFGRTVRQISADGFTVDRSVKMYRPADDRVATAEAIGRAVGGLARAYDELGSDVVVVLGDRAEALAAAVAASSSGLFVAHIHGGDVAPGDMDDAYRHAITKLAHVHLVASADAARRVVRLGENRRQVHAVGAPGLDDLRQRAAPPAGFLAERFGIDAEEVAVVVHHPIGRPARIEKRTMTTILQAVRGLGLGAVVVRPNNDAGHSGIVAAIDAAARRWRGAAVAESLERDLFLDVLQAADVIVGNSSCGLIEAQAAGTPAVNVGPRQAGRLRSRRAVIDSTEGRQAITAAIERALARRVRPGVGGVYGQGTAGKAIAAVLARVRLSDNLRRKHICY